MVYFRLTFTDANDDASGFGFSGARFATERHSFAAPSYGRVTPGGIDYPFNLACGSPRQYETDVSAWIYDESGQQSRVVVIHLSC